MTDDDLGRLMRRLDTATTPIDAPIPLGAERRLREIVGRPAARRRRRPRAGGGGGGAGGGGRAARRPA